jgi:hypothetical protein
MATLTRTGDGLEAVLAAHGRSPEIAERDDVYGWLVGSWDLDVLHYWGKDVSGQGLKGELHAAWVLEGRAVQDIWIMPPRGERPASGGKTLDMYGTTVRAWDASIQAWRITWVNPAGDHHEQQVGRRAGPDVVQLGTRADGTATRWRFVDIRPDSFHWLGEARPSEEDSWRLEGEFKARRRRPVT